MESRGSYRLVEHLIDFDVGLRDATVETIREYGAWFRKVLPERLAELTAEISRTAKLATWEPDRSPESLRSLEIWFASQVEARPLSVLELESIQRRLTFPIELPRTTLVERTRSLATDLGMYFGEVVLRNVSGARWELVTKGSRRYVHYGQPVLKGAGKVPLNPLHVITMTAYAVADGRTADLADLYKMWAVKLGASGAGSPR